MGVFKKFTLLQFWGNFLFLPQRWGYFFYPIQWGKSNLPQIHFFRGNFRELFFPCLWPMSYEFCQVLAWNTTLTVPLREWKNYMKCCRISMEPSRAKWDKCLTWMLGNVNKMSHIFQCWWYPKYISDMELVVVLCCYMSHSMPIGVKWSFWGKFFNIGLPQIYNQLG